MPSLFPPPLSNADRQALGELLPLLCRPELNPAQHTALRALLDRLPGPLPLLPSLFALEPLFRHHAIHARVDPVRLFRPDRAWRAPPFSTMAKAYYDRKALLERIAAALAAHETGPVLLIKGTALAEAWPSPALRHMCDMDLVVAPERARQAEQALESAGLRKTHNLTGTGWEWSSWGRLDLQVPREEFARRVLGAATQPPPWMPGIPQPLLVPTVPHHLVLLALHTAQHHGSRLWRDVCDARALLEHHPGGLHEALELLRTSPADGEGLLPAFLAFCSFLHRHAAEDRAPEISTVALPEKAARRAQALAGLYDRMAFETAPPIFLSVLRRTGSAPRRALGGLIRRLRRRRQLATRPEGTVRLSSGQDPILGRVPDAGTMALHLLKLRLLAGLWFTAGGRRYRRLLREDRRARPAESLFSSPME